MATSCAARSNVERISGRHVLRVEWTAYRAASISGDDAKLHTWNPARRSATTVSGGLESRWQLVKSHSSR
jgi:hypothetical protein